MKIFGMVRTFFSEDENSKNQNEIFEIGHSCFSKNERVFSRIESAHVFFKRQNHFTIKSNQNYFEGGSFSEKKRYGDKTRRLLFWFKIPKGDATVLKNTEDIPVGRWVRPQMESKDHNLMCSPCSSNIFWWAWIKIWEGNGNSAR